MLKIIIVYMHNEQFNIIFYMFIQINKRSVTIHVEDINDNPPQFSQTKYSFEINETTTVGKIGIIKVSWY